MQQEDDLRGLAKVMEFMRAISIVFIVIHVYWFCYSAFVDMGINIGGVDRILLNFQRTAGLFSNLLVTKVFAFIFLGLSCLGTKGVKNQKMTWRKIYAAFLGGIVLFFMNRKMREVLALEQEILLMSTGDLTHPVPQYSKDEIGILANELNHLRISLNENIVREQESRKANRSKITQ